MKRLPQVALLSLLALPATAQTKLNLRLKHELDSIYEIDQRYRLMMFDPHINRNQDSLAAKLGVPKAELSNTLFQRMMQTDYSNLARVQAILKQYGYPGTSLVGVPTNEAAWYVIQHAPTAIPLYLPMMKAAAEKGELPFDRYATMLDRQLMFEGKEQVYGTQVRTYNGQPPFVWPIQNPAQVNERRKQAGFKTTVEQNTARLGASYRVVTLEEVAKMPKQ
jgi:hypothetical protein